MFAVTTFEAIKTKEICQTNNFLSISRHFELLTFLHGRLNF